MKNLKRIGLISLGAIMGGTTVMCFTDSGNSEITAQDANEIEHFDIDEDEEPMKYVYDSTEERMEHPQYKGEMRPIIEAFVEVYKGISPQEAEIILSKAGKVSYSDIMYDLPSQYEKFEISVVNEVNEKVIVTFKDGTVIKKEYFNDYTDTSNINKVFVEYQSDLFKAEYSSGIITGDSTLISKDKKVWELEEDFIDIYN